MIGHKTGIRSLLKTEERQQNDPSSHKDRAEQSCHYLSTAMTDWNFSLIASSLLRTDRNLGTPPTNQETWFRAYLKSPPIFCEHLLEPDGWILLSQGKQARSINHAKKKGKWCGFYFFNLSSFTGHPEDSSLSRESLNGRIGEFHMNIPTCILHKSY